MKLLFAAALLPAVLFVRAGPLSAHRTPSMAARADQTGEDEAEEAEPNEGSARTRADELPFTDRFFEAREDLASSGRNPWFVLEPGYALVLEHERGGHRYSIAITVLDETRPIAGVETRPVEEKESVDGEVREVTRDYYAISRRTNNVYYFGEDVDVYEGGELVGHEGSWLAGEDGARYGLAMPGSPILGARYQQEAAPGRAMDRGEVVGLDETFDCPAGHFEHVLRIEETNPLEGDRESKLYAPGVGLLQDGRSKLVRYGK